MDTRMNEVSMKMKRMLVSLMLVFATAVVYAATYTWDGGGADNNWSTGANWNPDGSVPVSASDTLVQLDGTNRTSVAQNIAGPFVLNRLEFLDGPFAGGKAAISLNSNQLQFVANGTTQPRAYLTRWATCVINNAIDIPTGNTFFLEITTYGVTLNGAISGGGGIDKLQNAGGIDLNNSANSFSGGLTIRANDGDWCKVNVYASGAMGAGQVNLYGGSLATNWVNPGGLIFFNTTSHTNSINLFQNSPIFAGLPTASATVTLSGNIALSTYTLFLRGGGVGTASGAISGGGASAVTKVDTGTWTLSGNNSFTGRLTIGNGTIKLGASGTLNAAVPVTVAGGTLDLNGYSQTVGQLRGDTTAGSTNTLTSAATATLTVNQSDATRFDGRLTGALGLVKAGAGSLMLTNNLNTTTGNIIVSNGTLVVALGASLGSGNVTVAGGSLELRSAATIADTAALSIADGAIVLVGAGITETVDRLFLGGVQKARGTYGTTASGAMFPDDAHFSGTGLINVQSNPPITPTIVTWDAGGADTFMSSATNWVGDALPAFDGFTYAVFGTGGITATVDRAVNLYGLSFNRNGDFMLAAGAGVVTNGAGGILASAPNTTSRTYTLTEDVILSDHQTWCVTTNWPGATTLNVTGSIDDGVLPCTITKTEYGTLTLTASNTFDGAFVVSNGVVRITNANALGSTNGNTTVQGVAGGMLYLNGGNMNLTEPLVLNGEKNNGGTLKNENGSNTLSGPITCYNQVRWQIYGTALVIAGGVTQPDGAGGGLFVVNASSPIYFNTKPLNLINKTFYADSGGLTVLAVAGNTWADTLVATGTLRCDVPNALPPAASLELGIGYGSYGGTLDLNGNNQTVSKLYQGTTISGTRVISSATPALLTVNQSATSLFDGRFTGAVSLLKLGAGTLTLTNASTSTAGSFVVSNGTLVVGSNGTFGNNSTNVVVGGTGTLTLSNSVTIADSAMLSIANGGTAKVNLAAGVNEAVGTLYFGGVQKRTGTYGSTGSAANVKDDTHFAGTGILTVLHDKSGTMIKVK